MSAATWIGPAIVAAVISALVTGIGWLVSDRQAARQELQRRRDRIVDLQTALLAEIRASRFRLDGGDLLQHAEAMDAAFSNSAEYTPFVPPQIPSFVFHSQISEIHLLPNEVIDPVVIYYRQSAAISEMVTSIRSERYDRLDVTRKRAVYRDYIDLLIYADQLAAEAERALGRSLNIRDVARSDRKSAAGQDEASGASSSDAPPAQVTLGAIHKPDRGSPPA